MKKVIIFIILIIVVIVGYLKFKAEVKLEEILNFENIAYVEVEPNEKIDVKLLKEEFKNIKLKKVYMTDWGSTTMRKYRCFDKSNEIIYTIVDLGNRKLYYIVQGDYDVQAKSNFVWQKVN